MVSEMDSCYYLAGLRSEGHIDSRDYCTFLNFVSDEIWRALLLDLGPRIAMGPSYSDRA